ncbi:MAG TPA: hypothetical protein D7H97_01265 [Candidatus Poseidoniales archaeon]|nr:MAG TPA: hypothetical protein D7H97_01265 [Candidatus Poseidoniales archaeon]
MRKYLSAVLILVSFGLLLVPTTMGYNPGMDGGLNTGVAGSGCTCHGLQTEGVVPNLLMVGENVTITEGNTYTLEISFTGGPVVSGENQGGFLIDVDSGSMGAPGTDVLAQGSEATHSEVGNDQRSWQIEWTAGSLDVAEFTLRTNSVNGDAQASDDDDWNMATFYLTSDGSITQTLIEPEARLEVPDWTMSAIIGGCILLMAIMVMVGMSKKPRGRRGET